MTDWNWFWLAWFIIMLTSFAIAEAIAVYNKEPGDTLSESVWQLLKTRFRYPFAILFIGVTGWLFIHFLFGW